MRSKIDCSLTPYHCAVRDQDYALIEVLKKKGHNIEARDRLHSTTALWYNIFDARAIKTLLENGAQADSINFQNETVFQNGNNKKSALREKKIVKITPFFAPERSLI